jgi:hypothetical protein
MKKRYNILMLLPVLASLVFAALTGCVSEMRLGNSGNFLFITDDETTISGSWRNSRYVCHEVLYGDLFAGKDGLLRIEWKIRASPSEMPLDADAKKIRAAIQSPEVEYHRILADVIDGKFSGDWVLFYENGKIECLGSMMNGEPCGKWKWFDEDGKLDLVEIKGDGKT